MTAMSILSVLQGVFVLLGSGDFAHIEINFSFFDQQQATTKQ